jgi:hypothetical protein
MMVVRVSGSTFSAESLHNIDNRVISQPCNMHDNTNEKTKLKADVSVARRDKGNVNNIFFYEMYNI